MIFLTLKSAWRNILRKKQNAFIIILSMAIAFAFSNILISFVSFEANTDSFHTKKDKLFRLFSDDPFEPGKKIRYIQGDMRVFLKDNYPEVSMTCQVNALDRNGNILEFEDMKTDKKMLLAVDSTFFKLFDYELQEGSTEDAVQPEGIILKEKLAKALLGAPPYLDQVITIYNGKEENPVKVTGVLEPFEENTQLKFDAIVSGHDMVGGSIFLIMQDGASTEEFTQNLSKNELAPSLIGPGASTYELQTFTSTYYNQENVQPYDTHRNRQLIIICWGVVILLSITASFNFINLYVVGLLNRQKEIGVKRIFGAGKGSLMLSIGIEVGIFILVSLIISLAFTYYLLPLFNAMLNTQMTLSYFTYLKVFSLIIGGIIILGVFITIYLSYFVWRLKPIGLISDKKSSKVKANRMMFTVQFFITVGLVICSYVVVTQIQYIKNKPLGFNKHLLQVQVDREHKDRLASLKDQLLAYSQIENAALSSGNPISGNAIIRFDLEDGNFYSPFIIAGDEDFVKTLGLEIIDGEEVSNNNLDGMLVNETFVQYFDMKNPVGQAIPGSEGHIAGVVRDFNCRSLKQEIPPFIIGKELDGMRTLLVDISNADKKEVIALVADEWKKLFPDVAFEYKLIEDELMAKHQEDISFFRMIISFTLASLIISCFGLYGIASFTTQQRTKEIGIRKALGASFSNIVLLIWKDYVKLITISFVLAVPVVNYFLSDWLQEFAYKIELSWWLFLVPGGFIVIIALLTISSQSIRAANLNPVDSIKDE